MAPTRVRTLLVAGLVAAALGYLVGRGLDAYRSAGLPRPSWLTVVLLLAVAVALAGTARAVVGWVAERRHDRTLNALTVARLVAVAKAGAVFGALVCGGYAGFGAYAVQLLDSSAGQRRALLAGLTSLAGLAVAVASLRLERACRVPPSDGDPTRADDPRPPAHWEDGAARSVD